jgi:hypothetical protein
VVIKCEPVAANGVYKSGHEEQAVSRSLNVGMISRQPVECEVISE